MKQPVPIPAGEKACILQRMYASHITRPRPSALSKAQPFWPYLPPAPFVATPSLACAQATWEYLWSLEAAPQFVLAYPELSLECPLAQRNFAHPAGPNPNVNSLMKSILFSIPLQTPCSVGISGPTVASVTAHRPLSFTRKWALRTYSPPSTYISTMSIPALLAPYTHLRLGCWATCSNRTRVAWTRWGASSRLTVALCVDCNASVLWDPRNLSATYGPRATHRDPHQPQSTEWDLFRGTESQEKAEWVKDSNEEGCWAQGKGIRDFPIAQMVKNPPAMHKTWVRFLGQEDPLEKEMATHSSILAWRIPWTEEPGRLQSMGYLTKQITNTQTHSRELTSRLLMESCKSDRAT